MRLRLFKKLNVQVALSSIALHLAAISALTASAPDSLLEVTYLPSVELSPFKPLPAAVKTVKITSSVSSGTTQAAPSADVSASALTNLRESLYQILDRKLSRRPSSTDLLLAMKFSASGELESSELLKGSGLPELDQNILSILKNAKLYSSSDLANLRIRVPVRLR